MAAGTVIGPLILKVHFPPHVTKMIQFTSTMTIAEAIRFVFEREGNRIQEESKDLSLDDKEKGKEKEKGNQGEDKEESFGIFIPRWENSMVSGWLLPSLRLCDYPLKNRDLIEFRKKWRVVTIKSLTGETHEVTFTDTLTIAELLPRIVKEVGLKSIPKLPFNPAVGKLDKEVLPLHLPVPHNSQFLLAKENELDDIPEPTDEDLASLCSLYIWLPHKKGYLHKKGEKGVIKGWKRRWFSLELDKFFYYKHQSDTKPINFIPLQRVISVQLSEPFDSTSRKNPDVCFQLNTPTRVYYLMAESTQDLDDWTNILGWWLSLQRFFGPDRRTSLALFNQLEMLAHQSSKKKDKGKKGSTSGSTQNASADEDLKEMIKRIKAAEVARKQQALKNSGKGKEKEREKEKEKEPVSPSFRRETSIVIEREIRVALTDGSIQPLIVDANAELYDLVYAVAEEIGSKNAHLITSVDQGELRRVELLDHQKSLALQNIPDNAIFILKKTGIIDEYIGKDDIYDNHFLYVQLPQIEGYLLKNAGKKGIRPGKWCKQWFCLRGNKIYYYARSTDINSISFIPLFQERTAITMESPNSSDGFSGEETKRLEGCMFRINTTQRQFHLIGENPQVTKHWVNLLNDWLAFFQDDGSRNERLESVYDSGVLDSLDIPPERLVYTSQDFVDPLSFLSQDTPPASVKPLLSASRNYLGVSTNGDGVENGAKEEKEKEKESETEKEKEKEKEKEADTQEPTKNPRGLRVQKRPNSLRGLTGVIGMKDSLSQEERQKILQDLQQEARKNL